MRRHFTFYELPRRRLDKGRPPAYTPDVRLFLLIAALSASVTASADVGEASGRPAAKSRRLIENLPVEARVELRKM